MAAISVSMARFPPRLKSGSMEVSVGFVCSQISVELSTPSMAMSSGMAIADRCAAVITSAATASLAAKTALGFGIDLTNF